MIRVVIAEDHNLVRQGVRALLERGGEVEVVAEAATGLEAVQMVAQLQPDVVLLDLSMPQLGGAEAAQRILGMKKPAGVIILSMHGDPTLVQRLLQQGVKGYLLKDAVSEELMLAVRSVSQGKTFVSPSIADAVMMRLMNAPDSSAESVSDLLTPREREVLKLVSEGHTNQGIASLLGISIKTVEKHRANVMTKLEVNDLPSLIREGIRHGLILLDD